MFLMIEFPRVVYHDIEHMVVYFEKDLDTQCHNNLPWPPKEDSAARPSEAKLATMFDPDVWHVSAVPFTGHFL